MRYYLNKAILDIKIRLSRTVKEKLSKNQHRSDPGKNEVLWPPTNKNSLDCTFFMSILDSEE